MAMNCKVKNTFLEIKLEISQASAGLQRSSSVPRAFKPCGNADCTWEDDGSSSTTDGGIPESCQTVLTDLDYQDSLRDFPECCQTVLTDIDYQDSLRDSDDGWPDPPSQHPSECGRWADCTDSDEEENEEKSKVTLSLVGLVEQSDMSAQGKSKLCSRAQPFQSVVVEPPDEVKLVISQVADIVRSQVCEVHVKDACAGGTAMITCHCYNASENGASILDFVKQSLLSAAAESENSYIMGYNNQPFTDLDALTFTASIGCIPPAHRDTACWDTYMCGFCPRVGKCRWDHPSEMDIVRCIVVVKESP